MWRWLKYWLFVLSGFDMYDWRRAANSPPPVAMVPTRWERVTHARRCPVCGKPDWCTVAEDRSVACCMRVESNVPAKNGGWLHDLGEARPVAPEFIPQRKASPEPLIDVDAILQQYSSDTRNFQVYGFARELGVNMQSLSELGAVWARSKRAWAFPMYGIGQRLVGIRLRYMDGAKRSVRGSRSGLFLPRRMFTPAQPIFIAEGPTDTAALLSLGLQAIGRPSCRGQHLEVIDFVCRFLRAKDVIICADRDGDGRRGALHLADDLVDRVRSLKVITPPRHKDVREWVKAGATREVVELVVQGARYHRRKERV